MSTPITPNELKRLYPGASASTIARNLQSGSQGLPASKPKSVEGGALDSGAPRKTKGGNLPLPRFTISFRFFARRPLDWDNYSVKQLQDQLVAAGFLCDDDWRTLEGRITSEKVHTEEEERTEITIERLT